MKNVIILGGGLVGSAMARDLAHGGEHAVTVADAREAAVARAGCIPGVQGVRADLADPAAIREVVAGHDVVLGALSSAMGLATLRAVIEAGKNYVDASFMAEDATELSPLARARGVTCVIDCGIAPGLSNMMAGLAASQLETCERLDVYVGGLPLERRWPWWYKAGFAASDVIEEYVRPARLVEGGRVIERAALSEPELLDFEGVGTLEGVNTDGLRSLVKTLPFTEMHEKTLRYPGHYELMRVLRDTGFFSRDVIDAGGSKVRPLDVTAALLFPQWKYVDGERDLTVLRVTATGRQGAVTVRYRWDLHHVCDPRSGTLSMSCTTSLPATIVARQVLSGRFAEPGVHPPEVPGRLPGFLDDVLRELDRRGVKVNARVERA